jgi:hypothetical protein
MRGREKLNGSIVVNPSSKPASTYFSEKWDFTLAIIKNSWMIEVLAAKKLVTLKNEIKPVPSRIYNDHFFGSHLRIFMQFIRHKRKMLWLAVSQSDNDQFKFLINEKGR